MNQQSNDRKSGQSIYKIGPDDFQKSENHKSQQNQQSGASRQQGETAKSSDAMKQQGGSNTQWYRSQY
jgi:hypothetical protein